MTSHLLFLLLHDGSSSYSVSLHHCDAFTLESTEQHADKYIFLMMLVLFFLWIVSVKNFHGHIFIKGPSALYIQDFDYLTHEQAGNFYTFPPHLQPPTLANIPLHLPKDS